MLVALMLGASACNPGRPPAASVDGRDISTERVDDILEGFSSSGVDLRDQLVGSGAETFDAGAASQVLSLLVIRTIVAEEARDRGLQPSDDDRTAARDELAQTLGGQDAAQGEKLIDSIPERTQDWLVDLSSYGIALRAELAAAAPPDEAAARTYYDANPAQFTQRCFTFLQVLEADLPEAQARLDDGEDLGSISAELSTPESGLRESGGDGGCRSEAQLQSEVDPELVQQILDLPDGGVVGPDSAPDPQTGEPLDPPQVFLFEVSAAETLPFADVGEQILAQLPATGEAELETLLQEEVERIEVRVDPRFGHWDPARRLVVPPNGPSRPGGDEGGRGPDADPSVGSPGGGAATGAPSQTGDGTG